MAASRPFSQKIHTIQGPADAETGPGTVFFMDSETIYGYNGFDRGNTAVEILDRQW